MPAATAKRPSSKPRGKKSASPAARKKPGSAATDSFGGIGSAAVERATGKSWDWWLAILDKAGAREMSHPEIARLLADRHGLPPWWSQMVTVGYEQARGMRTKHERADGFSVSGTRTISVPVEALFVAWNDPAARARWLPGADLEVRKATPNKSMRMTWEPAKGKGASDVLATFHSMGPGKSRVAVEHGKLGSASRAAGWKKFWAGRLDGLKAVLEA